MSELPAQQMVGRGRPSAARVRRLTMAGVAALCLASTWALGTQDADAVSCPSVEDGEQSAVIVVDRGTGTPTQRCVTIGARGTGLDVLRAAHSARVEVGGFVCAIDGLPASGCATDDASKPYWRYWYREDGKWIYSSVGAFRRLSPPADGSRCVVEGWSYGISTSGAPSNAPRVAPGSLSCDRPAPPTTAPAAPTPTRPSPAPASTTAPARGAAPVPGVRGESPTPGATEGTAPASSGAAEGAAPASPGEPSHGPEEPDGADPAANAEEGAAASEPGEDPGEASAGDAGGSSAPAPGDEVAAARADGSPPEGAPPWTGALVALVLVAALGGGAAWRARARNA